MTEEDDLHRAGSVFDGDGCVLVSDGKTLRLAVDEAANQQPTHGRQWSAGF